MAPLAPPGGRVIATATQTALLTVLAVELPHTGRMDSGSDSPPDDNAPAEPVEVPYAALSPAALRGVVESFVLREGTDYGERELSHEEKVAQVLNRLKSGEARILYYPELQHTSLQPRSTSQPAAGRSRP